MPTITTAQQQQQQQQTKEVRGNTKASKLVLTKKSLSSIYAARICV
jgi:hypothetical protein